jgi:surfeit locus 1 family protein
MIRLMFSRRWLLTTFLVVLGAAVCVRLGFWQLDRLQQRRTFNAHVLQMQSLPPLDLNSITDPGALTSMEYRAATAHGQYDYSAQLVLRNQYYEGQYGYHLLTPLLLKSGQAVLVDRGWIPADGNASALDWQQYNEGTQEVSVRGILRLGQPSSRNAPEKGLWVTVDLEQIGARMPYGLFPVYLQLDPQPGRTQPPVPYQPVIELTEGPHLGYAIQWFTFAAILLLGYPFYLRKQEQVPGSNHRQPPA